MTTTDLLNFLNHWGYWFIVPLSAIEGPILMVVSGVLIGKGLLDWPLAVTLLLAGDLLGDMMYYAIGRWSWGPLQRVGRRFGLTEERAANLVNRMRKEGVRLLLIGKWTHAIGALVLMSAGTIRMSIPRFLVVNLLATLPKTAALLLLGLFAGQHLPSLTTALSYAPFILLPIGATAVLLLLRRRRAHAHPHPPAP